MNTGNPLVDAMSAINFEGNVIPHSWYQKLKLPNGKLDAIVLLILAEVIYWYRAKIEDVDETGRVKVAKKKFEADLWQISHAALADKLGLSKRQVENALERAEKIHGVLKNIVRRKVETVDKKTGKKKMLGNVLYLEPVIEKIKEISELTPPIARKRERLSPKKAIASSPKKLDIYRDSDTETSSEVLKPPTPVHNGGTPTQETKREAGLNPRALGTNPRAVRERQREQERKEYLAREIEKTRIWVNTPKPVCTKKFSEGYKEFKERERQREQAGAGREGMASMAG